MTPDERPGAGTLLWRKSTYSNAGNECVEVAQSGPTILVRDSKHAEGLLLFVTRSAWKDVTAAVNRAGEP